MEAGRVGSQEMLSDAISRIFSERASFELRDDDVEALRLQLRNGNISHAKGKRESSPSQQKEVEEAAQWKVTLLLGGFGYLDRCEE